MNNPNSKSVSDPTPISFQGDVLTVSTPKALPPGSRVSVDLDLNSDGKVSVVGKVISIRAAKDGIFNLRIRLHSVTKPQEELLKSI